MAGSASQAPGVSADPLGGADRTRAAGDRLPRSWLAGRYELLGVIGGGGMGAVYRARDRVLDRTVAVKVLPIGHARDSSSVARFEREARAAASLCHPNIVSVFDAGSDELTRYIVMEHIRGMSLAELLRRRGRQQPALAVDLARQLASGLAAAHAAGVIHRDVKPANVMVDEAATVKLLDFGIAQAHGSASLTDTGSMMGSACYVAPEVARGGAAVAGSDVYALGCVLYEMLTGRPPFSGELAAAILHQHATAAPRPPTAWNPDIPQALERLVMQMLAKEAGDRPAASELGRALAGALDAPAARRVPTARSPRAAGLAETARATEPLPALDRRRARHRRGLAGVGIALAVFCAVALAIALFDSPSGRGSRDSPASAAALARRTERQSWHLLTAAEAALREASRVVPAAVAGLEPAPAPAPAVAPPTKPKAKAKPHRPRAGHDRGQRATELEEEPAPSPEAETPGPAPEAEAPGTGTSPVPAAPQTPPQSTTAPQSP